MFRLVAVFSAGALMGVFGWKISPFFALLLIRAFM